MMVKIGDRAIYKPRVPTGRQTELFCFVTRVVDAERGIVDLVAFPAGGEFLSINNVAPKSELAQIHCWEPHIDPLEERVAALEGGRRTPEESAAEFERLKSWADGHKADSGITKRGPGRPRKDAA